MPWVVLHGDADQVCSVDEAQRFVGQVPSARVVRLPKVGHGFAVTPRWEPQYVAAYCSFAEEPAVGSPSASGSGRRRAEWVERTVGDLGLVEVEATAPPSSPALGELFAVILTGDVGWAEIDKSLAERPAAAGVPSLGWSSLEVLLDATHARGGRRRPRPRDRARRGALLGEAACSSSATRSGADALPFLAARLAAGGPRAGGEGGPRGPLAPRLVRVPRRGWLGLDKGEYPTPRRWRARPDPGRLRRGRRRARLPPARLRGAAEVVVLPGGHHFGGDYARVARQSCRRRARPGTARRAARGGPLRSPCGFP
ncbi:MAG: AcvB/VirJ family lysyl-phosphatidylglycerol hydrolase [Vicinamibacteria bacterium]